MNYPDKFPSSRRFRHRSRLLHRRPKRTARTGRYCCTRSDAMNMNLSVSTFKTDMFTLGNKKAFKLNIFLKKSEKWPPCGKGRSGQSNLDDEQNWRRKEKLPATILTDKVLINRSKTKLWISKEFALKRLLWADIFRWLDGASVSKRRQMAGRVTISLPVLTPHTNNTHTALVQVN